MLMETETKKGMIEFEELIKVEEIPEKNVVAGIDEVAVSPMAGPMISTLVVLPKSHGIKRLPIDSKKLNDEQIAELAIEIEKVALYISYATMEPDVVTNKGTHINRLILNKKNAVELRKRSGIKITLDGAEEISGVDDVKSVVRAESVNSAVSAASILAKHRSNLIMDEYHREYPYYEFHKNRGYKTQGHMMGIREYGYCPYHRNQSKEITKDPLVNLKGTKLTESQWSYIITELNKVYPIKEELMGQFGSNFFGSVRRVPYNKFTNKMTSCLIKIYFETSRKAKQKEYHQFNIDNNMWTFNEQKIYHHELNVKVGEIIKKYDKYKNKLTDEEKKMIKLLVKRKTKKGEISKIKMNKFRYLCEQLKL